MNWKILRKAFSSVSMRVSGQNPPKFIVFRHNFNLNLNMFTDYWIFVWCLIHQLVSICHTLIWSWSPQAWATDNLGQTLLPAEFYCLFPLQPPPLPWDNVSSSFRAISNLFTSLDMTLKVARCSPYQIGARCDTHIQIKSSLAWKTQSF